MTSASPVLQRGFPPGSPFVISGILNNGKSKRRKVHPLVIDTELPLSHKLLDHRIQANLG